MPESPTDRIEKHAVLRAPIERVWSAISDSAQFGAWFKARFHEPFVAGRSVVGEFTEPGYVGRKFVVRVEEITEPERFAFRWHPHEMDRPADSSPEATLVQFLLEPHPEGTLLRIVESGFDRLPPEERERQLRANSEGWDQQIGRVSAYVSGTDRIEKQVTINAPIERVWRAISEPEQFAAWFGLDATGARFVPGSPATMTLTSPSEYAGTSFTIDIVSVEAGRLFAFRWHPYALDKDVDYSAEPTTLVEFFLEPAGDGTLLTVTESGFNAIPEHRRAVAFQMNDGGWTEQVQRIRRYVNG
jgi:uncharacterized protein YndB with AHSA1/START domain